MDTGAEDLQKGLGTRAMTGGGLGTGLGWREDHVSQDPGQKQRGQALRSDRLRPLHPIPEDQGWSCWGGKETWAWTDTESGEATRKGGWGQGALWPQQRD